MGGKPLMLPREFWGIGGEGEPMAEIPSDVPGYQDILREMSVAMQIIRNNQDPCCSNLFLP